jgi:uncharacterized protein YpmS
MMKTLLYIFILFPLLAFGQSNKEIKDKKRSDAEKSEITSNTSIVNYFSALAIVAYQEKAVATIKDFYNYVNLYQSASTSAALGVEIDQSINHLFFQENILVKDIFDPTHQPINLPSFLLKCKQNKGVVSVSNFVQNPEVGSTYFTFQYTLQVEQNAKRTAIPMTQKVYFFPSVKQFGNVQKNVWQLKLGGF